MLGFLLADGKSLQLDGFRGPPSSKVPPMPRYKLTIEYDGTAYCGWQRQANGRAVQQALEEAIARFCGQALTIRGAGRTDTGVHATAQVAHVDLPRAWADDTVRDAINAHLVPEPVAVVAAAAVGEAFDARFSATRRHYLYRIVNRRAPLTLDRHRAWLVKRHLDAEAMHAAAQRLVGRHDFSTFRDADCQAASPLRTLERLDVARLGEEIHVRACARSFLHRQVRSMVGALVFVGSGKWHADDLQAALEARDRARCATVAPAAGLALVGVDYDLPEAGPARPRRLDDPADAKADADHSARGE
jgi:tRNA pseudouridine38-40 synthase